MECAKFWRIPFRLKISLQRLLTLPDITNFCSKSFCFEHLSSSSNTLASEVLLQENPRFFLLTCSSIVHHVRDDLPLKDAALQTLHLENFTARSCIFSEGKGKPTTFASTFVGMFPNLKHLIANHVQASNTIVSMGSLCLCNKLETLDLNGTSINPREFDMLFTNSIRNKGE